VPQEAIDAGAQWHVTSGPDTGWKNTGVTVSGIPTGNCTVGFKVIARWDKPADRSVTINKDATTNASGTYVRRTDAAYWALYE
jgi:hypothetical protein